MTINSIVGQLQRLKLTGMAEAPGAAGDAAGRP